MSQNDSYEASKVLNNLVHDIIELAIQLRSLEQTINNGINLSKNDSNTNADAVDTIVDERNEREAHLAASKSLQQLQVYIEEYKSLTARITNLYNNVDGNNAANVADREEIRYSGSPTLPKTQVPKQDQGQEQTKLEMMSSNSLAQKHHALVHENLALDLHLAEMISSSKNLQNLTKLLLSI